MSAEDCIAHLPLGAAKSSSCDSVAVATSLFKL